MEGYLPGISALTGNNSYTRGPRATAFPHVIDRNGSRSGSDWAGQR